MRIAALTATALLLGVGLVACTPDRPAVDDPPVREGARASALPPAQAASMPMPAPGVNASHPTDYRAYEAAKAQLLPLLASGNPRQRLAALLMQPDFSGDDWHQAVVGLLLADGGRDPLLAGLALVACARWEACPREQVLALTAGLADDDASLQLRRLALLDDPALREPLWEAAAQAPAHHDLLQRTFEALMEMTTPLATTSAQQHVRSEDAFVRAAATAMPGLLDLIQRCPAATEVTDRVLQCRQIALLLAESHSLLIAQTGLGVLLNQALPPAEATHWDQLYRQLRWQLQLVAPLMGDEPMYLRQMAEHGERGAIIWLLRQHGLPLSPPPHWQPGQPTGY